MRKPVIIDAPYPTAEDIAEIFHIGKARMRKLDALVNEIRASRPKPKVKVSSLSKARAKKRVLSTGVRKEQALKQG